MLNKFSPFSFVAFGIASCLAVFLVNGRDGKPTLRLELVTVDAVICSL